MIDLVRKLAEEVERAHQFLDECYISGDGTEPLVERIGRALAATVWAEAPGYIVCRDGQMPFTASRYHKDLKLAMDEAEHLCRKERDTFILFVAAGEVRPEVTPVSWMWAAVRNEAAHDLEN